MGKSGVTIIIIGVLLFLLASFTPVIQQKVCKEGGIDFLSLGIIGWLFNALGLCFLLGLLGSFILTIIGIIMVILGIIIAILPW